VNPAYFRPDNKQHELSLIQPSFGKIMIKDRRLGIKMTGDRGPGTGEMAFMLPSPVFRLPYNKES
jgi:hypothetical protein